MAGSLAAARPCIFAPEQQGKAVAQTKYENILVENVEGVTTVTLNRPEKRNAMSPALDREMLDCILALEGDPNTKVLVLAGAGGAWCAGMDLKLYFREL